VGHFLFASSNLSILLGLALANFGRDLRSRNRNFFGLVNNTRFRRFLVGKISRYFNTLTSIGKAVKT